MRVQSRRLSRLGVKAILYTRDTTQQIDVEFGIINRQGFSWLDGDFTNNDLCFYDKLGMRYTDTHHIALVLESTLVSQISFLNEANSDFKVSHNS